MRASIKEFTRSTKSHEEQEITLTRSYLFVWLRAAWCYFVDRYHFFSSLLRISQLGDESLTLGDVCQRFDPLFLSTVSNCARENASRPSGEIVDELVWKTQLSSLTLVAPLDLVPVVLLQANESTEHRLAA